MRQASSCTCDSGVPFQMHGQLPNSTTLQHWLPIQVSPMSTCSVRMLLIERPAIVGDLVRSVLSAPSVLLDILPSFIPYSLVLAAFAVFIVWNGGIVLGEAFSTDLPPENLLTAKHR